MAARFTEDTILSLSEKSCSQWFVGGWVSMSPIKSMSLVSLLSPQKNNNIFQLEVSFVLLSFVAPLSWQVDGIVGQTYILSNPPFHVYHGDAIY
jgi:hypothetical protein